MVTFDELLSAKAHFHRGRTVTWGIDARVADLLHRHAAGATTLETGSGRSTLTLLHGGVQRHIAIQPNRDEFDAIEDYARQAGIPTSALHPIVACSQDYLPTATLPPLDIVLIDGAHAFPIPFLDWYFTARALKVGGLMIVDDIHIATGTILADFLAANPRWVEVFRDREALRFAAYRKTSEEAEIGANDWLDQPYLKGAYPTRAVRLLKRHRAGQLERLAARLPWRVQEHLRQRFAWPRPSWVE